MKPPKRGPPAPCQRSVASSPASGVHSRQTVHAVLFAPSMGLPPSGPAWTGTVAGSVSQTYSNDFNVLSRTFNAVDAIAFALRL